MYKYKYLNLNGIVSGLASTKQLHDKSQCLFMKKEEVGRGHDHGLRGRFHIIINSNFIFYI